MSRVYHCTCCVDFHFFEGLFLWWKSRSEVSGRACVLANCALANIDFDTSRQEFLGCLIAPVDGKGKVTTICKSQSTGGRVNSIGAHDGCWSCRAAPALE